MNNNIFSGRANNIKKSFLREILSLTKNADDLISFAGGLPNPNFFPSQELRLATKDALNNKNAPITLQYSASEGHTDLRKFISSQYKKKENIIIDPNNILILNGSQQALDLLGKIFVNNGDTVLTESPTYLAAIQAIGIYEPEFIQVSLEEDCPNLSELEKLLKKHSPKFFYMIPNFQNPTGITCSLKKRKKIARLLEQYNTILVEDDPYGEIRFDGNRISTMYSLYKNTILLGSFSKTVAPGLRLGWIVAPTKKIYEKLYIMKQASDLHSNNLSQHILHQYIKNNDTDAHIKKISKAYGEQKDTMIKAIKKHLPDNIKYTNPNGGMFLWLTFPNNIDAVKLFKYAIDEGVAFVPGEPFYSINPKKNTARLNFSNASKKHIEEGIKRLATAYKKYK